MIIITIICVLLVIGLSILLTVAVKRLIQHDAMTNAVASDIDDFYNYMSSLISRDLYSDAPEYNEVHKNLKEFTIRLQLHSLAFRENYKRNNKKKVKNPPVVI